MFHDNEAVPKCGAVFRLARLARRCMGVVWCLVKCGDAKEQRVPAFLGQSVCLDVHILLWLCKV